jgi:hypothetical protein
MNTEPSDIRTSSARELAAIASLLDAGEFLFEWFLQEAKRQGFALL